MDVNELLGWLTDGLDDAEKAVVTKAVQRDAVKTKAAGLKAEAEFNKIVSERVALQQELEGDQAAGKVGTRAYRKWYEDNGNAAVENDKKIREFDAKHGAGSFAKALAGELPGGGQNTGAGLTEAQIQAMVDARIAAGAKPAVAEADIQRMVDSRIQGAYAPKWSELLEGTGSIVQKHMYAGRKTPIDFKKLSEIASTKNVPLEAAYDEWDKPERERIAKEDTEKEITRRVDEEIQKRGNRTEFPAGADATPGALSVHKDADKFDKNAFARDLASGWNTATQ